MRILARLMVDVRGRRTSVWAEGRGAVATFLTMAYILPVNAVILGTMPNGPDRASLVAATALAAGVSCLLMGLIANFPVALAPGMGLNALVAGTLVKATGSWRTAMGLIVLDGLLVLALVLAGVREAVMRAIPRDLRLAIGAGIGLFIALIGLKNAGIIAPGPAGGPLLVPGDWHAPGTLVALIGLGLTAILMAWRVHGALVIGIAAATGLAVYWKVAAFEFTWAWPPTMSGAFKADVWAALDWKYLPLLFAVAMVDFFDALGTVTAIAEEGKLDDEAGVVPGIRGILAVDAAAASVGGLLGASSVTAYIESAAGVAEGARTGLHTVIVGLLFLLAIVAAPLLGVVPAQATAPALILVGFLMLKQATGIDFDRPESAIPAFLTLITIPTTYSIAHGVGFGFIAYVVVQLGRGRVRAVHPIMYGVAAAFAAWFAWGIG